MTEKQARKEGLSFTGKYEGNYKDEIGTVKVEAKRIRDLGFRAVVVEEPNGKSVYADKRYFIHRDVERFEMELENIDKRKQYIKDEYEQKLKEIEGREEYLKNFILNNK